MAHLLVRHNVADFNAWEPKFEDHEAKRDEAGIVALYVWTRHEDPNDVFILFEVEDLERAVEFTKSEELRTTMEAAGVVGTPEILILDEK